MLAAFTPTGVFGFYAGLNVLAFFLIFFFLYETKQRTLEELDYVFGVPTRTHAAFQGGKQFPWWFRRYVLQRKGEPEPELYHFDHVDYMEPEKTQKVSSNEGDESEKV